MKRLLTLLIFAISLQTYAQLPDAFNYQATIRAESGDLLVNTNVNFKVTIFEGQGVGASYQELHFVGSDDLGHVNFVVGYGEPLDGSMSEIDWSMGNYYMKVELDTGQGFVDMGDTQLLSVPYALYAMDSGGEVGDLQSVLDAGGEAEIFLNDDNLAGLKVMSTGGDNIDGNYNGIQSIVSGPSTNGRNTALSGISTSESSYRNYGVWGTGQGSTGINSGVVATTTGQVGENLAVWGYANSSEINNIAGAFYANGGDTATGSNSGIVAEANSIVGDGLEGFNYGVRASASGAFNNYGIYATATGAQNNYGIYASAPVPSEGSLNYAGYFSGDVRVNVMGYLKADNTPVADNDVVNKAYLESILQSYDDRLAVLEEVVESLQESGSLLVDQDGNIVLTQDYGEDTWATENVKVVTYRDGTPIPYVANLNSFDATIGHWTYANGDPSTGEILYNRQAIMGIWDADSAGDTSQRKELAPEGWHVASNEDWNSLIEYMTNTYGPNFAKEMASTEGWVDQNIDDTPGTVPEENNASGFNLKPNGYGYATNGISSFGQNSVVWGDYDETSFLAGYFFIDSASPVAGLYEIGPELFFFSARFVQGEAEDNNVDGYCGNGIIEQALGEQCDDGNEDPNDGCDGCMIVEVDLDGDGYSVAQGDCNDNNIYVYPGAVEVCDQVDNNCNGTVDELDENTFTGEYNIQYNGEGITAAGNTAVFGQEILVNLEIAGNNERSFTVPSIYPELGGWPGISVGMVFNCNGNVALVNDTDVGIGCGNENIILSPSQFGSFNPIDDSSFTLQFQEDSTSACGNPGTTVYTFTKVN